MGSLTIHDTRYKSERKSRDVKKAAFNKNRTVFTRRLGLNVGKKLVKF